MKESVLLITGSTGIAASTALKAAKQGAKVFFTSRTSSHCEALADQIKRDGGTCAFLATDLKKEESSVRIVEAALKAFGRIDALYNVAGISGRELGDGPLHECTAEGWDLTIDTNVRGMFFMCRAVIRQMLAQPFEGNGQRGCILNMGSVLGFAPSPRYFATHAYAASKGAIVGMSKSMASYYAPHKIRVNVIAPAIVRTPMSALAQENPAILEFMQTKQPLAEDLIDADDVADASLFLLGAESRMITGEVVSVDGGWCVSG